MALKYLITGATGGLGKQVLRYFVENVPLSDFAAASSKPSNKSVFENRGIAFRHVDYNDSESLDAGLRDVENLLFVSSNGSSRIKQHERLIEAAKKAGVEHVWYTSLAFGGFGDSSRSPIQAEHVQTERMLKEYVTYYLPQISSLSLNMDIIGPVFYIPLSEKVYIWKLSQSSWTGTPKPKKVILPSDGEVAYTLRAELAEATARIMIRGGYENQTVLFTAEETITAKEMVDVINEATGRQVKLEIIPRKEYIRTAPMLDDCGRPKEHFETIASRWDDIVEGALSTTHPLMHEILRREPTKPRDALRQLLTDNRDYTYP